MSSRPIDRIAEQKTSRRVDLFRYASVLCLVTSGLLASCDRHTSDESADALVSGVPDGLSKEVAHLVREQMARIDQQPDDAQRYLELGMLYDRNALPELAAVAYAEAVRMDPGDARALYHLGRMRDVLGDVPGAIEALEACAERAPDEVAPRVRLGDLQLSLGALDAARASFAMACRVDDDHPAGAEGLARVALAEGEAGAAADVLEDYVSRHPERGYARFLLGTAYRALGRLEDARHQLELGSGSSPAAPDPWLDETEPYLAGYHRVMERAVELGRAGGAEQVVESLRALRREQPDDVAALEKLVAAELQLGRTGDALEELDEFTGRFPDHPRAWYLRALVLEARGDLGAASLAVARSIAVQESWVPAHELAARLSWRMDDLPAAATSLERALHFGGPKTDTMLKLARARSLLGDPLAARTVLREATLTFPRSVDAWLQLCTELLGGEPGGPAGLTDADLREARAALDHAHALAPGDPRVVQLDAALGVMRTVGGGGA